MQTNDTKVSFGKFDFDERLQKVFFYFISFKIIFLIGHRRNGMGKTNTGPS